MRKIFLLPCFSLLLFGVDISQTLVLKQPSDSFITKYEYGKMLYNNPRGISCAKCHGEDAKGKLISRFNHTTKIKTYRCEIRTEDITKIPFDRFRTILDPETIPPKKIFDKSQVCEKMIYGNTMPKYFLTSEELDSIHYYITNIEKKKKGAL